MDTIIAPEPSEAHPLAGVQPLAGVFTPTHLAIPDVTQYDHHKVVQGIPIASRYDNPREISEMVAFCDLLAQRGLSGHVQGVFYDSKADLCTFEFNGPLRTFDGNEPGHLYSLAHRILVVALETIYQFDWFGYAEHGKPYDEVNERLAREFGPDGLRGEGTEQEQGQVQGELE